VPAKASLKVNHVMGTHLINQENNKYIKDEIKVQEKLKHL